MDSSSSSEDEDQTIILINPPPPFLSLHCEDQILHLMESFNKTQPDCCLPRIPTEDLQIKDIVNSNAYLCILESLWESRTISTDFLPSPPPILINSSPTPFDIWDIPLPPEFTPSSASSQLHPFISRQMSKSIPNTETIILCTNCSGIGIQRCSRCSGRGGSSCSHCNGIGRKYFPPPNNNNVQIPGHHQPQFEICSRCDGTGRHFCSNCLTGQLPCKTCTGLRFIKQWKVLTVTWNLSSSKFLAKESSHHLEERVTRYLLHESSSSSRETNAQDFFFEQECSVDNLKSIRVQGNPSIDDFSSQEISKQINNTSSSNNNGTTSKRVCQFKHRIGLIPLVKVIVEFKGKEFIVNIVGKRKKIFWEGGFPARDFRNGRCCCCLCSIT